MKDGSVSQVVQRVDKLMRVSCVCACVPVGVYTNPK